MQERRIIDLSFFWLFNMLINCDQLINFLFFGKFDDFLFWLIVTDLMCQIGQV